MDRIVKEDLSVSSIFFLLSVIPAFLMNQSRRTAPE